MTPLSTEAVLANVVDLIEAVCGPYPERAVTAEVFQAALAGFSGETARLATKRVLSQAARRPKPAEIRAEAERIAERSQFAPPPPPRPKTASELESERREAARRMLAESECRRLAEAGWGHAVKSFLAEHGRKPSLPADEETLRAYHARSMGYLAKHAAAGNRMAYDGHMAILLGANGGRWHAWWGEAPPRPALRAGEGSPSSPAAGPLQPIFRGSQLDALLIAWAHGGAAVHAGAGSAEK